MFGENREVFDCLVFFLESKSVRGCWEEFLETWGWLRSGRWNEDLCRWSWLNLLMFWDESIRDLKCVAVFVTPTPESMISETMAFGFILSGELFIWIALFLYWIYPPGIFFTNSWSSSIVIIKLCREFDCLEGPSDAIDFCMIISDSSLKWLSLALKLVRAWYILNSDFWSFTDSNYRED